MRQVTVYVVGAIVCGIAAALLYPFFPSQGYKGFEQKPLTIVVFLDGSLGKAPVVEISALRKEGHAVLTVAQPDMTQATSEQATIYVGVERWGTGFEFSYAPLDCVSNNGDPSIAEAEPDDPIDKAVASKLMTSKPALSGSLTAITFATPVTAPSISCDLDSFGFSQESIAVSSIYIPGIEAYALDGVTNLVRTYTVGRDPSEYLERASQQPSEVLATAFTWYERDFELLARQGLFVSVSSPQAQQESSYRLFVAGALVGLGSGLAVAAIQSAIERRRPTA